MNQKWKGLKQPLTSKRLMNALTDLVVDREHGPKIYRLAVLWAKVNARKMTESEFFITFGEAFKKECHNACRNENCACHSPAPRPTGAEWEVEFDKHFPVGKYGLSHVLVDSLKFFIRSLLSRCQQDQERAVAAARKEERLKIELEQETKRVKWYEQWEDMPDAVDAIEFRMEQQGLKAIDLVPYIGSRGRVSEVLHRKRPLTISMIRRLHKGLHIPAQCLIKLSLASQEGKDDVKSSPTGKERR